MRTFRDVEVLDRAGAQVGEGPAWDAARGELAWVDILSNQVRFSEPDGTLKRTVDVGTHVGAVLPAEDGTWLLATQRGFAVLDEDGQVSELLAVHTDRPDLRFNDAKVDPRGRAFAGTMSYDESKRGAGALYRLDAGPTATVVLPGVSLSNGLGWSPDGSVFWYIDSLSGRVIQYAFGLDSGELGERVRTIEIEVAGAVPDGLCIDDEGCAWVALFGGSAVRRYTPGGELDAVIELPTPQITSCAFGGPGMRTLYITSAARGRPEDPLAGGLFALEVGATGPAATPWRPLAAK